MFFSYTNLSQKWGYIFKHYRNITKVSKYGPILVRKATQPKVAKMKTEKPKKEPKTKG